MSNSVVTLLCASVVGTLGLCDICRPIAVAAGQATLVSVPAIAPSTVTLQIEGMTCGGCAIAARKVLERLDGVQKAEVSHEKQRAVVTYDPDKVSVEQMIAVVKRLGYTATLLPDGDATRKQ